MKKVIIILGFLGLAQAVMAQTKPTESLQLNQLGVQPSNPNGPGKPDPPPPPVKTESPVLKQATEVYKSVGSPEPIMNDGKKGVLFKKDIP